MAFATNTTYPFLASKVESFVGNKAGTSVGKHQGYISLKTVSQLQV